MTSSTHYLLRLAPILVSLSCAAQMPQQEPVAQTKKFVQFTTHKAHDWNPDWSPDGQWIAFESFRGGDRDIYIRRLAGGEAIKVTDHPATDALARWSPDGNKLLFVSTRSGSLYPYIVAPFEDGMPVTQLGTDADSLASDILNWSPDGAEVVYCASTEGNLDIWALPVSGGPARRITDRPERDYHPDWSPDGQWIVFSADTSGVPADLWVVPAAGGEARQLTFDQYGNSEPAWSPDGRWIAFWTSRDNEIAIAVMPSAGGEPVDVGVAGNRPRWAPDSRRICHQGFTESGDLWVVPVDGGDPVRLADNADIAESGGATWSPDGSEVAFVSADGGRREIWKATADGSQAVALTAGASVATGEATVRWSPDGARIAFVSDRGGQKKVWAVPAAGGELRSVSTTPGEDMHMAWSPDSERLAIASGTPQVSDIWIMAAAGGTAKRLVSSPGADTDPDWSPDGERIAFASTRPHAGEDGAWNIWTVAASGGEPVWLTEGRSPHWSPDGSELLHVWDNDVWTVPVAGGEAITVLALGQDSMRPRWAPDGHAILYSAGVHRQADVWIADVSDIVGP